MITIKRSPKIAISDKRYEVRALTNTLIIIVVMLSAMVTYHIYTDYEIKKRKTDNEIIVKQMELEAASLKKYRPLPNQHGHLRGI